MSSRLCPFDYAISLRQIGTTDARDEQGAKKAESSAFRGSQNQGGTYYLLLSCFTRAVVNDGPPPRVIIGLCIVNDRRGRREYLEQRAPVGRPPIIDNARLNNDVEGGAAKIP